jgi:hypothetical protein
MAWYMIKNRDNFCFYLHIFLEDVQAVVKCNSSAFKASSEIAPENLNMTAISGKTITNKYSRHQYLNNYNK